MKKAIQSIVVLGLLIGMFGITSFFSLGRVDTDKSVSPEVFATQGLGPYYQSAYPAANQTNVNLRGKNNNYNAKTYQVYGIWDEETW